MPDINSTVQALEPILGPLNQFIGIIQYLVGGIFGLYLILVVLRWYESRRLVRLMKDVRIELEKLNKHFGVKPGKESKIVKAEKKLLKV